MTREEAIKLLQHLDDKYFIWGPIEYHEALNMAMESLKNEGRKTNLEHYFYDWTYDDDKVVITFEEDMTNKFLNKDESCKIVRWLLKPYEPPKYKLTKFEYDLLNVQATHWYYLKTFGFFERLMAKGYFKDIPIDVTVKDILDNCEVIDDD